jgi:hypothetical protein
MIQIGVIHETVEWGLKYRMHGAVVWLRLRGLLTYRSGLRQRLARTTCEGIARTTAGLFGFFR